MRINISCKRRGISARGVSHTARQRRPCAEAVMLYVDLTPASRRAANFLAGVVIGKHRFP